MTIIKDMFYQILRFFKNKLLFLCLLFPNTVFAFSCISQPLSDYAMSDQNIFVTFRVIDSEQLATDGDYTFINIEILEEFISNKIDETIIRIDSRSFYGIPLYQYTENSEWLTILIKSEDNYALSLCAPKLQKQNEFIIGDTGIEILDNSDNPTSINDFRLAINAHWQGLSLADSVCYSNNSFCTKVQPTYDIPTGELTLPSIQYELFGYKAYSKAKLKKQSNNPLTFMVTEMQ